MKWSRDPLVSHNHPLNGSRRSVAPTCDTMHDDVTVIVHHQSLPSHMGQPSLSRAWAHRDSSPTSLSPPRACSPLLLSTLPPSLCSPSPAAAKPAHRYQCGSITQPSSAEGAPTPSSSNKRLTAPGDHRWPTVEVSTPPPFTPNPVHHQLDLLPGHSTTNQWPPVGRPDFAGKPLTPMGEKTSHVFAMGRKAPVGRTVFTGWAECTVDRARLHSVVYNFPSDLFKYGLNFGNS
jgi:hypothetical protein